MSDKFLYSSDGSDGQVMDRQRLPSAERKGVFIQTTKRSKECRRQLEGLPSRSLHGHGPRHNSLHRLRRLAAQTHGVVRHMLACHLPLLHSQLA